MFDVTRFPFGTKRNLDCIWIFFKIKGQFELKFFVLIFLMKDNHIPSKALQYWMTIELI